MKLKDKDKNKDCKWQSFFFNQIHMHKQYSPHGDYDNMGEAINLVNNLKSHKITYITKEKNIKIRFKKKHRCDKIILGSDNYVKHKNSK